MEEQLISFETARLAKEKGFDWKCDNHWELGEHDKNPGIFMDDLSNSELTQYE